MIKKIFLFIIFVVCGSLILASLKPDNFHVQRTLAISAPAEIVFSKVTHLRQWGEWSPWEKKDPEMKKTFSGEESGKGAIYAWEGNSEVGKGSMEITDVVEPTKVTIKLSFEKPFAGENVSEFILQPNGTETSVTWSMYGKSHFICKVIGLFMNMDKMIGNDFEAGLSELKKVSEATAVKAE